MISLTSSVANCAVNTGYAPKSAGQRQQDPNVLFCPTWHGTDSFGRVVCADSFYTKSAGCHSALDRVDVENYLRPRYFEYITLDSQGYLDKAALGGEITENYSYHKQGEHLRQQAFSDMNQKIGSAGYQTSANTRFYSNGSGGVDGGSNCTNFPCMTVGKSRENYVDTRSNQNFQNRRDLSSIAGYKSNCNACHSGN